MTEPTPASEPEIQNSAHVAEAINAHIGGGSLSQEQINLVLGAYNAVRQGEPVGTIMKNTETGAIAHRVETDGVHLWRVSLPNGEQWTDLSPTLPGWDTLSGGKSA